MLPAIDRLDEWTFDDLQALPEDVDWRRYEIVDGALVVSPAAVPLHEYVIFELMTAIRSALPPGYSVIGSTTLDLHPSYRIPDVNVIRNSVFASGEARVQPADVLLAVEVVSPSSITTDRITKPAQYAAAGIAGFWRVETMPEPALTAHVLDGDVYRELGTWRSGELAVIRAPFEVTVRIDALTPPTG